MWKIQPLAAEHVHSLAECHIACWREAYQGLVPAHVLDAFDVDRRADGWEQVRAKEQGNVYVAIVDDAVIGFAAASRAADRPVSLELHALYVRAGYYGTGLADQLIDTAIGQTEPCSLWVFEENPRALQFYRRHRFELDGTRKPDPWSGAAMEVRMVRN